MSEHKCEYCNDTGWGVVRDCNGEDDQVECDRCDFGKVRFELMQEKARVMKLMQDLTVAREGMDLWGKMYRETMDKLESSRADVQRLVEALGKLRLDAEYIRMVRWSGVQAPSNAENLASKLLQEFEERKEP